MRIDVDTRPRARGGKDYHLLIDGELFDAAEVDGVPGEVILHLANELAERTFLGLDLCDIPAEIDVLMLRASLVDLPYLDHIRLDRTPYNLMFAFFTDVEEWKGEWSLSEYVDMVQAIVGDYRALTFERSNTLAQDGFGIGCTEIAAEGSIWRNLICSANLIQEIQTEAANRLRTKSHRDSVVIEFAFPPETRVACEQYLVYFAQFLADLGVSATAQVTQVAGQVLFSVRPDDARDALSTVREALEIYLTLPSRALVDDEHEVMTQRLMANIEHLRGQLLLARATISAQERALRAQDYALELQNRISGGLPGSVANGDREEILGGTFAIKPLEGKGFEVNLPKIFRYFRKRFGRD